jgi:hypothetical protein
MADAISISRPASPSTSSVIRSQGLIGAIQRQAATLMHVSNLYGSPQGERLASGWST